MVQGRHGVEQVCAITNARVKASLRFSVGGIRVSCADGYTPFCEYGNQIQPSAQFRCQRDQADALLRWPIGDSSQVRRKQMLRIVRSLPFRVEERALDVKAQRDSLGHAGDRGLGQALLGGSHCLQGWGDDGWQKGRDAVTR